MFHRHYRSFFAGASGVHRATGEVLNAYPERKAKVLLMVTEFHRSLAGEEANGSQVKMVSYSQDFGSDVCLWP